MKKNRIALLTWYSNGNYGTILQAYALKVVLDKIGNCDIIKFKKQRYKYSIEDLADSRKRRMLIERFYEKIYARIFIKKYMIPEIEKSKKMKDFIAHVLNVQGDDIENEQIKELQYDYFVCGSDQIWNPYHFDPIYFLYFVSQGKKIAYAPSFGVSSLGEFPREKRLIQKYIKEFDAISVREESGKEIVKELIGKEVQVCLDPTLLIKCDEWEGFASSSDYVFPDKYIYCLFLGDYCKHIEKVKEISDTLKLPIYLHCYNRKDYFYNGNSFKSMSPIDFVAAIKNASFVCTDSFHATVFSIVFHKAFISYKRFADNKKESQNSRIENLLKITSLTKRLEMESNDLKELCIIDYVSVDLKLDFQRDTSINYLENSIK